MPLSQQNSMLFSAIIFMAHFASAIYIVSQIFNTQHNCRESALRVHYTEHPIFSVQGPSPVIAIDQGISNWPVVISDPQKDSSFILEQHAGHPVVTLNVARCMKTAQSTNVADKEKEMHRFQANTIISGACALRGLLPSVETTPDPRYVFSLGSANNALYLMLVFEWISTGFALYYIDPDNEKMDFFYFKYVTSYGLILWNFILIFLTFYMATATDKWSIPINNVIIGTVSLLIASAVQMLYALITGKDSYGPQPVNFQAKNNGYVKVLCMESSRAGDASREGENSIRRRVISSVKSDGNEIKMGIHWKGDWLETLRIKNLVDNMSSVELRYAEYAITAPLLIMGAQSTVVLGSPLWAVQAAYVGMLTCNLIAPCIHKMMMATFKLESVREQESQAYDKMWYAALLALLASWAFFIGGWMTYIRSVLQFVSLYPKIVAALVFFLPVAFMLFGVVGTWLYWWVLMHNREIEYSKLQETITRKLATSNNMFDLLSIASKLTSLYIIILSNEFGPSNGCVGA